MCSAKSTYNHVPYYLTEPNLSLVVAIKMKNLYFVTLQSFIFVFNISRSTSVSFV